MRCYTRKGPWLCVHKCVYICKLLSIGNASARLAGCLKHLWWQNNSLKSFLDYKLCSQLLCFASFALPRVLTLTVQNWSGQETAFYGIWRFITILQGTVTGLWLLISILRFFLTAIKQAVLGEVKTEKFWHQLGSYAKQCFINIEKWNVLCAKVVYGY